MRVGIYSEAAELRENLCEILKVYFGYSCIECEIDVAADPAVHAGCLSQNQYDIFFVDLDMKEDCWEAVEMIRYIDSSCSLVLLSDESGGIDNAVRGYRSGAADYLLKPLLKAAVMDSLGGILKKRNLTDQENKAVKVRVSGIWSVIALDNIVYIESAGHMLLFYMMDGSTIRVNASFKDYGPVLERNRNFCRCHKSFQVNLNHVAELRGSGFILTDGRTVNISRKFKQSSKADYINHIMERYVACS